MLEILLIEVSDIIFPFVTVVQKHTEGLRSNDILLYCSSLTLTRMHEL